MTSKRGIFGVILILVVYCGIDSRGVSGQDGGCVGDKCGKRMQLNSIAKDNLTTSSHSNSSNNNKNDIQEITFHTPSPPLQPQALNMMVEGEDHHQTESSFQPTPVPNTSTATKEITNSSLSTTHSSTTQKITTENSRGRALNFTVDEKNVGTNRSSKKNDGFDLSDVTIDDDDEDVPSDIMIVPKILSGKGGDILAEPEHETKKDHLRRNDSFVLGICEQGGLTYENGEKIEHGCDMICTCNHGKMECVDRCTGPFFKKGKKLIDPLCTAKDAEDPCCSVLDCAADTETEPTEMCTYENKTYNRGDIFNKTCSETCTCNAGGQLHCKSRCPPTKKTSDRCVELPDPNDQCCKQVLCDVTLDDHQDAEKEDNLIKMKYKVISATQVNDSVILLETEPKFEEKETSGENLPVAVIEVSNDKSNWVYYQTLPKGLVYVKEKSKYLRLEGTEDIVEIKQGSKNEATAPSDSSSICEYNGKKFPEGESYNDDCEHICVCQNGEMKCIKLECPTYFGVDVMDPNCIEWETVPPNFKAFPPKCCPDKIKCKNNGSCAHSGFTFKNWEKIPSNLTGCEKTCYCEMGHIECQQNCPPVPALPPSNLPCAPHEAVLQAAPHDECCKSWECNTDHTPKLPTSTKPDKKGQNKITTDDKKFLGPLVPFDTDETDNDQRLFGPLTVYKNEEGSHSKPHVSEAENPFYKNPSVSRKPLITHFSKNHNKSKNHEVTNQFNKNSFISKKPVISKPYFFKPISRNNSQPTPPLVLNPDKFLQSSTQQTNTEELHKISEPHEIPNIVNNNLPNYVKSPAYSVLPGEPSNIPNNFQNFGKPPYSSTPNHLQNYAQNPENNIQDILNSHQSQTSPIQDHHIELHGNGSPEDLLEFVRNHPEISNFPSGSVLEISPVDAHKTHNPPPNPNSPVIPILIHPSGVPPTQTMSPTSYVVSEEYLNQILGQIHGNRPLDDQILSDSTKGQQTLTKDNAYLNKTGFNNHFPDDFDNSYHQPRDEIEVHNLEAIDPHTVKLAFVVPPIYVGLHGRVEVRYTHTKSNDIETWESQIFAPPNDLIETPTLEFDLQNLLADKEYQIKISITLRDLHNTPASRVYKIRTPKEEEMTTLPPIIPIEPDLKISDINSTWVTVVWRKFTEYELQFIDGLQLRYREVDGKIYLATPLIHRAVTTYTVEQLKPNVKYEIGIFFIPFPNQKTELNAEHMLHFTTANEVDTYGFSVALEISQIKATSVEISWSGVPYPEDKYVNIYRAIYQSDSGKEDQSTFKIAKRDSPTKTIIMDLKPGTRYRLWLEVYLTNGKIKTSNVQDFITKPRAGPVLGSDHDKISRAEMVEATRGDYYGPLVIVAILASIAILSTLILLLILVRRHNQNKAAITPPSSTRLSNGAYDNPTYKVEIQQETMGL